MKTYSEAIPSETLEKLISFLNEHHEVNAAFSFYRGDSNFLTSLRKILKNIPEVKDLIKDDSYIVTRKVNKANSKIAFKPHFDNYSSTVVIPLKVPDSKLNGDIVLWENARRNPENVITHFLSKLFYQNPISTFVLVKMFNKNKKFIRHSVKPGDIVHFNGFVSLHFNLNVDSGERMSLLIMNNKKFENTFIVKMVEKYSQYVVK